MEGTWKISWKETTPKKIEIKIYLNIIPPTKEKEVKCEEIEKSENHLEMRIN